MLISPAYAQGIGGGGFSLVSLLPLVLIFVVFYFLLIRPQQTKARAHRNMVGNVRRGDSVVTGGGIIGKVTKVIDDDRIQVEIADGVRIVVAKGTIGDVVSRGQPAREPPTRRSGKRPQSARRTKPEEPEDQEFEEEEFEEEEFEDEEDLKSEDDESLDEDAEDESDRENEDEPEEVEPETVEEKRGPTPGPTGAAKKRRRKNAAS